MGHKDVEFAGGITVKRKNPNSVGQDPAAEEQMRTRVADWLSSQEVREIGTNYCQTTGSAHYKAGSVEALDLIIAKGFGEHFCLGNVIKYAARFSKTRNLEDLKKAVDYAHIVCGLEITSNQPEVR